MITRTLDVSMPGNQFTVEGVHISDNGMRTLRLLLDIDGRPFTIPKKCTATLFAVLPGGNTVFDTCSISDNAILYTMKGGPAEGLTAERGTVECEVRLTGENGEIITTPKFSIEVEDILQDDSAIEAESSFSALTDALGQVLKTGNIYVIPYSEDKKAEIAEIVSAIKADTGNYAVVMEYATFRAPALIEFAQKTVISATFHEPDSQIRKITVTRDGDVTLSLNPINIDDVEKISNDGRAPTGSVVMQYVQDYVAENGGAAGDAVRYGKAQELSEKEKSQARENIGAGTSDFDGSYWSLPDYPKTVSAFRNDAGYLTEAPVTSVNGQTGAVVVSASSIGALPSTYTPPDQTAEQVGADAKGTADSKVAAHNTDDEAHNDIRLQVAALINRLNAFLDIDDTTTDQLSEVLAIINDNKDTIEAITTSKVNVSDIINNLTTNVSNKPLSAAQGVALKALIDAITVPTKLSELTGDSTHRTVTDAEKTAWNAKSNFSGAYADLTGKPTIPTVPTKVSAFENDKGYLTQHQDISGKADKSSAEAWTFTLKSGETVTKRVVLS